MVKSQNDVVICHDEYRKAVRGLPGGFSVAAIYQGSVSRHPEGNEHRIGNQAGPVGEVDSDGVGVRRVGKIVNGKGYGSSALSPEGYQVCYSPYDPKAAGICNGYRHGVQIRVGCEKVDTAVNEAMDSILAEL